MKFKPSLAAEEFIENIHQRLGARNKAVLGRSALFLALGEGVPSGFKPADSQGKDLDDETVIGDELRDVVSAALNHRAGKSLDETGYRQAFRQHFEFGCHRLKEIWEDSGNDQTRFVATLLKLAGDDFGKGVGPTPIRALPVVEKEVKLKVLTDAPEWSINGPGTSNGLLVISGQPGSGKSQLALDLLAQLSSHGVRFVFFDMKGELEDDPSNAQLRKNRTRFLEQTGASYVRFVRQDLPINPFYRDQNPAVNAQIANEIAALIRAFAPQLGANQQQAISDAYQNLPTPDFTSLLIELQQNGVTGVPVAIINRIVDYNLFASAQTAISPEQWLDHSMVIDFKEFGNDTDTKALAVALILNFLIKKLSQQLAVKNDIQPLKMVLFVDEAHLLLPKENKAGLLSALARQGRSWGFPVWMASQDADKFLTTGSNETNFADLAECGVHFSPQTLSPADQKLILGGVIQQKFKKNEAALRLQGKLQTGMARQFWKDQGK
jgi:DNA sulfur modification protein DndE